MKERKEHQNKMAGYDKYAASTRLFNEGRLHGDPRKYINTGMSWSPFLFLLQDT